MVSVRSRHTLTKITANAVCTDLVPYGSNLGSTVGLFLSQTSRNIIILTPIAIEIIIGCILGDGNLRLAGTGAKANAYLQWNMSIEHLPYLLHILILCNITYPEYRI